jgi:hypothetical protein
MRARAGLRVDAGKGFAVWSIEIMRPSMPAGDDLPIDPDMADCHPDSPQFSPSKSCPRYRMVIGILDASGRKRIHGD